MANIISELYYIVVNKIKYRCFALVGTTNRNGDPAGNVVAEISNLPTHEPITENIYSGTTTGSRITEGGLEDKSYFQFQVVGVDADDDISVAISLDGINFVTIPVVNVADGTAIAAGTNIEAAGMYRYGNEPTATSLRDAPAGLGVKAVKITRETAVGSNQVDVTMRAC